jgi:hypothetical protein
MELSFCYGTIKDVELNLKEEEIISSISSPGYTLTAAKRLNRRSRLDEAGSWQASETIRLCFKGPSPPAYVVVDGLRIKVERYTFPVTQCYRCWKIGHSAKLCPAKKIVCPKCTGNHETYVTSSFKCVNCSDRHPSFAKICPVFLKERKIRELMAEFSCTYRKALEMYVIPSPPPHRSQPLSQIHNGNNVVEFPFLTRDIHEIYTADTLTFEENKDSGQKEMFNSTHKGNNEKPHRAKKQNTELRAKDKKQREWSKLFDKDNKYESDDSSYTNLQDINNKTENEKVSFEELLSRLRTILFMKNLSIGTKVEKIFKLCIEWFILVTVKHVSDGSIIKYLFDFINGGK